MWPRCTNKFMRSSFVDEPHATVTVLVMQYLEPSWTELTLECLAGQTYPCSTMVVSRVGIGGLSSAFNAAMSRVTTEYVWHVTNVEFPDNTVERLVETMRHLTNAAAVHPVFDSDHPHLQPSDRRTIRPVPFVEWTAPFVRVSAWDCIGPLDDDLPYWGMDLDWSARARQAGYTLHAVQEAPINHTYLRHTSDTWAVSVERKYRRALFDASTEARLVMKYGPNWLSELWPTHPHVAEGKKTLYAQPQTN